MQGEEVSTMRDRSTGDDRRGDPAIERTFPGAR